MYDIFSHKTTNTLVNFRSLDNINFQGSCIYIIRNSTNDKLYVGQCVNYGKRYSAHKAILKTSNVKCNPHLLNSFKRGDSLEMSILEICDKELLDSRETFWISFFGTHDRKNGYNLTRGGKGGTFVEITQETRAKRSKSRKGLSIDNSYHNIPILAYSVITGKFIKEYESMKAAASDLGISRGDVSSVCAGKFHRVKTYTFRQKHSDNFPLEIEIKFKNPIKMTQI